MRALYGDILSRIAETPRWWDENGVPRFDDFHPTAIPDIYANEAVLYRVRCQQCGRAFDVADSWSWGRAVVGQVGPITTERLQASRLSSRVPAGRLSYGDPPRHGGEECSAGDSMTSEAVLVLQFWRREGLDWERVPSLEGRGLEDGGTVEARL